MLYSVYFADFDPLTLALALRLRHLPAQGLVYDTGQAALTLARTSFFMDFCYLIS